MTTTQAHAATPLPRSIVLMPVILSGTAMIALIFVAVAPVLSLLAQHLGGGQKGAFVAQMVMSTPGIGIVLGGLIAGPLTMRLGAPKVLCGALLGYALFGGSALVIEQPAVLIGARFLLGVQVAAIATATSSLISGLFGAAERERLFGLQAAVGAGGALIGVWSAGLIGAGFGWRAPFALYIIALPMAFLAMIALRGVDLRNVAVPLAGEPTRIDLRQLWPAYLLVLLMSIVMQMTGIQTGLVLAEDHIRNPAIQSVVLGMGSVTGVLAGLVFGRVRRALSFHAVGNVIVGFWCVGQISIGLSHGALPIGAAVALSGMGSGLMMSFLPTLLLQKTPAPVHTKVLGLYYSIMFMGDFLNPMVMASLRAMLPDYHAVFIAIGLICGVCLVISLATMRWRRPLRAVVDHPNLS